MQTGPENVKDHPRMHRLAAGLILIILGAAVILAHWIDIGDSLVFWLGMGMLVLGSSTHKDGWIIPGGVLTGIGLGILVLEGPWHFPPADRAAIFLLCFAFGWFMISLLSALFACRLWWPLIPGGIMASIAVIILLTNGSATWADLNLVYALILISLGALLLVFPGRTKKGG